MPTSPKVRTLIVLTLLALIAVGCSSTKDVALTINGKKYRAAEVEKFAQGYIAANGIAKVDADKNAIIDEFVKFKLLERQAKKAKLNRSPEYKALLNYYQKKALVDLLLEKEVTNTVDINEDDVRNYFNTHYDHTDKYTFGEICVADEKTANEIDGKLKVGAKFEDLARTYSILPSRSNGGVETMLPETKIGNDVLTLLRQSKENDTKGPIKTKDGFVFIQFDHKTPAPVYNYDLMKDQIRAELIKKSEAQAQATMLKNAREKAEVFKNDDVINQINLLK